MHLPTLPQLLFKPSPALPRPQLTRRKAAGEAVEPFGMPYLAYPRPGFARAGFAGGPAAAVSPSAFHWRCSKQGGHGLQVGLLRPCFSGCCAGHSPQKQKSRPKWGSLPTRFTSVPSTAQTPGAVCLQCRCCDKRWAMECLAAAPGTGSRTAPSGRRHHTNRVAGTAAWHVRLGTTAGRSHARLKAVSLRNGAGRAGRHRLFRRLRTHLDRS